MVDVASCTPNQCDAPFHVRKISIARHAWNMLIAVGVQKGIKAKENVCRDRWPVSSNWLCVSCSFCCLTPFFVKLWTLFGKFLVTVWCFSDVTLQVLISVFYIAVKQFFGCTKWMWCEILPVLLFVWLFIWLSEVFLWNHS